MTPPAPTPEEERLERIKRRWQWPGAICREHSGDEPMKFPANDWAAHGPSDIAFLLQALATAHARGRAAGLEEAEKSVPTNWCDSLLQRPGKKLTDPWSSQDIERLLSAIAAAIRALRGPA